MKKLKLTCIIDDDPIFVFTTKKLFDFNNYCESILIYHNGKEALEGLKPIIESNENVPELILLDLNMPIMDGWQFLDEFSKLKCNKKIVLYIVSSSIDPVDIERAKTYREVSNYIIKPITRESLAQIIDSF
ncbi:response regulator [Winogradskyella echinorum]|uniref:Response regulator n=1 Tax=Winogradskyella echinorum TaxID=538189 RepID=A0ABR6Y3P9_9FLAO|nr:response regulator [Winogradskyella echinorum]MBC3847289.1 response regulator [Winogradskyella echinorum]MBC5751637.1 response regulator [Winogradskyella echinorum]